MHRRQLLKLMSLAGAGSLVGGLSLWTSAAESPAFFLVTDDPHADLDRLRRLNERGGDVALSILPIRPAPQDLTLLRRGALVDPHRTGAVPAGLAAFADEVRRRRQPGHSLLTIQPRQPQPDDAATFTYNGTVYERVSLRRNYDHIEIPGAMGPTVFRLRDGALSVVTPSCRHEHCKKMGARTSGRIICAPNRLVAALPHAPGGLDAVSG